MATLSPFLCLCFFLYVRAEMNNSCQSSTTNTVFYAHLSFEDSSLCAEPDNTKIISAVQLTMRYSRTASPYNFISQCLQSIIPQHIFDQSLRLLVHHTLWPKTRLRHIRVPLPNWLGGLHNSRSKFNHNDYNYRTTMLSLPQCTVHIPLESNRVRPRAG